MTRLLVIDKCLTNRLAGELRNRGCNARSAADLKMPQFDEPMLDTIAALDSDAVLITSDDDMPAEHAEAVARSGVTLAIVDLISRPVGFTQAQWPREVVHRWAHRMREQPTATIRRYGLTTLPWTDRKRRVKS